MAPVRKLTDRRVQGLAEAIYFREDPSALAELSALYREHKRELAGLAHRHAILRKVLARITLDELAEQRDAAKRTG
jgi:septal ring factor EnvC (AmiA/AmiB activator)